MRLKGKMAHIVGKKPSSKETPILIDTDTLHNIGILVHSRTILKENQTVEQ